VDFTRCFAASRLALASWYLASRLPPSKSDQERASPSVQFSLSWGWLPPSWLPPYEPMPLMSGKKFRKVWRSVASAAPTRSLTWRYSGRCLPAAIEVDGLEDQVVLDRRGRVHVDGHRGVERDPRRPQRVPRADQIHARVRHINLGARDVGLGPSADVEEALRRPKVQLRALNRLLLHADQALGEQDVRVRLLHGE